MLNMSATIICKKPWFCEGLWESKQFPSVAGMAYVPYAASCIPTDFQRKQSVTLPQ